jgi:hypothetical protein
MEDDPVMPRGSYMAPKSIEDAPRRAYANPGDLQ